MEMTVVIITPANMIVLPTTFMRTWPVICSRLSKSGCDGDTPHRSVCGQSAICSQPTITIATVTMM